MIHVYSEATGHSLEVQREIGRIEGRAGGPTVFCTAGIHGNEPSGVFALERLLAKLAGCKAAFWGNFIAVAGNMAALAKGVRYIDRDLNRIWQNGTMGRNGAAAYKAAADSEHREQREIHALMDSVMRQYPGPYYFIDLHTTSAHSVPFITLNDSMPNRAYARRFPLPVILGIEEFLHGPLLNYINEFGHIAIGFEAGSHNDPASIERHEAFLHLALAFAGCLPERENPYYTEAFAMLEAVSPDSGEFFEIRYRHAIKAQDEFRMKPDFVNFAPLERNTVVAESRAGRVQAPESGRMFMPLYQQQGEDGYFILRHIPPFWLELSAFLRKRKFEVVLLALPGIRRHPTEARVLVVNRRIARLLAVELFHLFGYRLLRRETGRLFFARRD